jgi:hypothetical protein
VFSSYSEYRTIDKVRKPSDSVCYTLSSEPLNKFLLYQVYPFIPLGNKVNVNPIFENQAEMKNYLFCVVRLEGAICRTTRILMWCFCNPNVTSTVCSRVN